MNANANQLADETIEVTTKRVACDGGGGALGHPKVYLEMGEHSEVTCPYCSRHYVLAEGASLSEAH
ncbi:MAG: zinc-finger domain-containing protein [Rhodospirillaceae bacterium]|jgi:uncharacterized Zn-finger protein|nr:zinc-finger domain-containing protein [Rhodospirillaceae bacterium]